MKTQREFDNNNIIRSGSRIRESVRSLPKGHFQQIRQMFDKQINSTKKLSTIYERQQKISTSQFLLHLPVTDDEKLKHTNEQSVEERYRDYLAEYQAFRLKLTNEFNQHKSLYPSKDNEQYLKQSKSLSNENYSQQDKISYITSLPISKSRQINMSSAVNYTDSYDSLNHLNRTGSSRQYVSSLQHTLSVHAKPVLITTPVTCNIIKRNPQMISDEIYPSKKISQRLHSSTSLSSTGYDSNSSPSIKSKRNSITTNNSNDFIIEAACSTSSSASSIDEQQSSKPWIQYESNPSIYNDEAFESSNEYSPIISRTEIQLKPSKLIEQYPENNSHSSSSSSSSSIHEPLKTKKSLNNSSFILQTTSFPNNKMNNEKSDRKIRRWNVYPEREEIINTPTRIRKYPLVSTNSTGFQIMNINDQPSKTNFIPINEQKHLDEEEDENTPLPVVENPIYDKLPPKKPPRTYEHENNKKINEQKVPSSSSNSNSPILDLGARSISCMDLTAGVTNTINSNRMLLLTNEQKPPSRRSSVKSEKKKSFEEIKPKTDNSNQTPIIKSKTNMKKGISEPNLTKRSRSKSPFSPRGLIDRFKRILPLNLSKQSLNQIDSDDSISSSSETNEHIRTSKLDHVSRVKSIYDSLTNTNHLSNIRQSINDSINLFDYVIHLLPEHELGYFSNGNGCISTSNISHQSLSSSSVVFKYPFDAKDEKALKDFCFPDQYDANNNPLILPKKSFQEYFRFTLTNMFGVRQYGYCSRFFHKGKSNALCIVSPYDIIEIYEKILGTATELFLSYKDEDAKKFLQEIYSHKLPNRGDTIHIDTTTVGLYTLKCEFDRRKESIDSTSLLTLSTETIIKIFSSILYEQKIIFIGNDVGPLTRLINTFIYLLYPFSWPHTYVPILPALMLDIIQAPTPYIIGILRSCESYLFTNDDLHSQDNSDILIVDIDNDRIRSMNDYLNNGIENFIHSDNKNFQILPKIFKIELKQEISLLRKNRLSLSLDECQQRLSNVFMSIFVQSCYNYKDFYNENFQCDRFLQSKQHTIELFLEWFTRTQIFQLFIREKFQKIYSQQFALTFDLACEEHMKIIQKQTPQRMTVKSVKRKSATRANKQN